MKSLWQWWKRVARKIGDFQGRAILTLFYFVVLAPFALAVRFMSDPLAVKPGAVCGWRTRRETDGTPLDRALRQS